MTCTIYQKALGAGDRIKSWEDAAAAYYGDKSKAGKLKALNERLRGETLPNPADAQSWLEKVFNLFSSDIGNPVVYVEICSDAGKKTNPDPVSQPLPLAPTPDAKVNVPDGGVIAPDLRRKDAIGIRATKRKEPACTPQTKTIEDMAGNIRMVSRKLMDGKCVYTRPGWCREDEGLVWDIQKGKCKEE